MIDILAATWTKCWVCIKVISFATNLFVGWDTMYINETLMTRSFSSVFCKLMSNFSHEILLEKIRSNLSDEEIIQWTDELSDESIRVNVDGTYLDHDKPTDPHMNRQHYSLHKKRHLTKAVLYCFSSGFIAQVRISSKSSIRLLFEGHIFLKYLVKIIQ